jgi:hypothetical protein
MQPSPCASRVSFYRHGRTLFLQPQGTLMHQSGALQRMVGTFLLQIVVCDPPQFVINQRNHGAQYLVFARTPVLQQLADDFGRNLRQLALGATYGVLG